METLTWLHLSDWHQGNKGRMDRRVVRDALIEDIQKRAKLCHERLAHLDFLIFSGDLAFKGSSEEYELAATEFLNPVLDAAGLGRDRLFMVPGNHDVDRSRLTWLPDFLLKFDDRAKVTEAFEDPEIRAHLLFPMRSYSEFVKEYLAKQSPTEPEYAFVRQIEFGSASSRKSVAILGLNSAWMCGHFKDNYRKGEVNDYGRLILSEHQLRECFSHIGQQRPDVVIAAMHHPFPWFSETEDRAKFEDELIRECHFVLRGHEHKAAVTVPQGTAGNCAIISAGAAYDRREYPNGYNYMILEFERGQGTVYLRRYDDWRKAFVKDTVLTADDSPGFMSFTLPKNLGRGASNSTRRVVWGDPWGVESPATMTAVGEVYRRQHENSHFSQLSGSLVIQLNSFLPEAAADQVIISTRFRPADDPIYCHRVTLMWAEGSDYRGDVSFSLEDADHNEIGVVSVPITAAVDPNYAASDPRHTPYRQLLLFFDPILQPDVGKSYTLQVREKVKDTCKALLLRGKDELYIVPQRSAQPVEHMRIVVLVPESFDTIELRKGGRDTTGVEGELMTEQEINEELGRQNCAIPPGFRTYGWQAQGVPNNSFFAVDLMRKKT